MVQIFLAILVSPAAWRHRQSPTLATPIHDSSVSLRPLMMFIETQIISTAISSFLKILGMRFVLQVITIE